jgi:hypothetical protein
LNEIRGLWTGQSEMGTEREGHRGYLDPVLDDNVVSEGILSEDAATATAGLGRGEVGDENSGEDKDGSSHLLVSNTTICQ